MGRSFEETKRMVIEIITNIDPGITEKDIEQMLEDEMKKPLPLLVTSPFSSSAYTVNTAFLTLGMMF